MRLADTVDVHDRLLAQAAASYDPAVVPAVFRGCPAILLAAVQRLSGDQWRRCELLADGRTFVIHNHPVW
jgi:hypothetical protein